MSNTEKVKVMRDAWFQYVVDNKNLWANGFTLRRLEMIRQHVFNDTYIMSDLLDRHGAADMTPADMKVQKPEVYNHCIGNLTCAIFDKMVEKNIYKIR